jgi:hypothetical protein
VAVAAFPTSTQVSGLAVAEIEGAKGEGVAGAAFSTGARDEGGAGVWTILLSGRSDASISQSQFQ